MAPPYPARCRRRRLVKAGGGARSSTRLLGALGTARLGFVFRLSILTSGSKSLLGGDQVRVSRDSHQSILLTKARGLFSSSPLGRRLRRWAISRSARGGPVAPGRDRIRQPGRTAARQTGTQRTLVALRVRDTRASMTRIRRVSPDIPRHQKRWRKTGRRAPPAHGPHLRRVARLCQEKSRHL